jgi:hypothetical protein
MQGKPHGFINNEEMMDFYKNQLNRVNGAMPMLPVNDYAGLPQHGAPIHSSNLMMGGAPLMNRMAPTVGGVGGIIH